MFVLNWYVEFHVWRNQPVTLVYYHALRHNPDQSYIIRQQTLMGKQTRNFSILH
jgi:hypothetical protein